ncbi:cell division protein FtsQ/DivIB, partial [Klebsiella pneumoniae]|uniref:cell division protein FtsQ/DivIB n=1 Tax=Klebsiella pneumoniae TaxID=573 RepID=UPI00272F1808
FWPVLLVVLGFGTYEGAQRLLPYADRPITKISVQGDLSYISQQAVQQRIGPYLAASFFTIDLAGMRSELEQMPWIATIGEMNCVRKHLSAIKGGRLAKAAWPATVYTYAISDVPGDQATVIASGPT